MPRPELAQIKQRHAELTRRLDTLDASEVSASPTDDAMARQEIIDEMGKIEHWLWMLEPD